MSDAESSPLIDPTSVATPGSESETKPSPPGPSPAPSSVATFLAEIEGNRERVLFAADSAEKASRRCTEYENHAHGRSSAAQSSADKAATVLSELETLKARVGSDTAAVSGAREEVARQLAEATSLLATVRSHQSAIQDATNAISQQRAAVENLATQTAERSKHVEDGQLHAAKAAGEIDQALAKAQASAGSAEAQHLTARTAGDNVASVLAATQATRANIDKEAQQVAALLQKSEMDSAATTKLAGIAGSVEERVQAYEDRLAHLETKCAERLKTIESLLPGAASAGLASAFNSRRGHFRMPQVLWQVVFVLSLLALFALAGVHSGPKGIEYGLLPQTDATLTWDHIGLSLVYRLPFVLPLIWLAFHSSHKAALAQQVEEDYAFKEAVSRSFEGYRREMMDLEGKAAVGSALSRLCAGTLAIITNPPGRLYEKHPLNKTPLNALAESAGPIAEAAAKFTPGKG